MYLIKEGASIAGCRAEILIAYISVITQVFRDHGKDAVITSGTEEYKHSVKRSRHYSGDALDIRSRWFDASEKSAILMQLQNKLGKDFVVLLESNHFHIHYAPVYKG